MYGGDEDGARSTYARARLNTRKLGHGEMGEAHLLSGILALGEEHTQSPIPRLLRQFGADLETLMKFLQSRDELGSWQRTTEPVPGNSLQRTLERADMAAWKRSNNGQLPYGANITDLLNALLESEDELLFEAFAVMDLDVLQVRMQLDLARASIEY